MLLWMESSYLKFTFTNTKETLLQVQVWIQFGCCCLHPIESSEVFEKFPVGVVCHQNQQIVWMDLRIQSEWEYGSKAPSASSSSKRSAFIWSLNHCHHHGWSATLTLTSSFQPKQQNETHFQLLPIISSMRLVPHPQAIGNETKQNGEKESKRTNSLHQIIWIFMKYQEARKVEWFTTNLRCCYCIKESPFTLGLNLVGGYGYFKSNKCIETNQTSG